MTPQLVLSARGLVKKYGRVVAIDHADFDLRAGEILAVIGDNGAGKSSLIKALSGANPRYAGSISIGGTEWSVCRPIHFSERVIGRNLPPDLSRLADIH